MAVVVVSAGVLAIPLVRGSGGSWDREASMREFSRIFSEYQVQSELEAGEIGDAFATLFDDHRGANLGVDFCISQVLNFLGASADNFVSMEKRVREYLQENSSSHGTKIAESGKNAGKEVPCRIESTRQSGHLFHVGRGRGPMGGVVRWSDIPESK